MKIIPTLILMLSFGLAWAGAPDNNYTYSDTDGIEGLQVFNDGHNTYIQSVPGLVIRGATVDGSRFIVAGTPNKIQGAIYGQTLLISRFTPMSMQESTRVAAFAQSSRVQSVEEKIKSLEATLKRSESKLSSSASSASAAAALPGATAMGKNNLPVDITPLSTSSDPLSPTAVAEKNWDITPGDSNMRVLIARWATSIKWNAVWDVDNDITLESSNMSIPGDFRKAVRYVLSSTEMGDLSLKPCFYINNVVRVVRRTAKCDPSE
jgi:hypothetical protein